MKGPLVLTGASFAYRRDTPKITKPLPLGFTTITKPYLSRSWNDRVVEGVADQRTIAVLYLNTNSCTI